MCWGAVGILPEVIGCRNSVLSVLLDDFYLCFQAHFMQVILRSYAFGGPPDQRKLKLLRHGWLDHVNMLGWLVNTVQGQTPARTMQ